MYIDLVYIHPSLVIRSGERILDIGCGDGTLTIELQKRGCKVVGIDFAPDMIAAAVERVSTPLATHLLTRELCSSLRKALDVRRSY